MNKNKYKTGDFIENKGVLLVITEDIQIIIAAKDAPGKLDWYDAKKYCEDQFMQLPTSKILSEIYNHKKEINKALKDNNCEPLKDDWYWSSSEGSDNYAWAQSFSIGAIFNSNKTPNGSYVRPVLAL